MIKCEWDYIPIDILNLMAYQLAGIAAFQLNHFVYTSVESYKKMLKNKLQLKNEKLHNKLESNDQNDHYTPKYFCQQH